MPLSELPDVPAEGPILILDPRETSDLLVVPLELIIHRDLPCS